VASAGASGQLATSAWPDYGAGALNTHQANCEGPYGNVRIAWQYALPINTYSHAQAAITQSGLPSGRRATTPEFW